MITNLIDNAVKQLATTDVVQDQVELVGSVEDIRHANDMGVLHALKDRDLSVDHVFFAGAQCLVDDLDGKFFVGVTLHGQFDNREVTSAKLLAELVLLLNITL